VKELKNIKRFLVIFSLLTIAQINLPVDFFFNTKDGMGIHDKTDFVEYTLGFPFSEIGFITNIDKEKYFTIGIYGGVDFLDNSYRLELKPLFNLNPFELSFPLSLTSRPVITNEATEVGRTYVGIVPALTIQNRFKMQFGVYYSAVYLWYDPAFEVNIPTFRTDEIFRANVDLKITYISETFLFSVGYNTSLRWLSYRSTFITGENTIYFEGRFKVSF